MNPASALLVLLARLVHEARQTPLRVEPLEQITDVTVTRSFWESGDERFALSVTGRFAPRMVDGPWFRSTINRGLAA